MPEQRILAGAPATLEVRFLDSTGEPSTVAGPVTVTVTRADGTAVVTDVGATASGETWTYALTSAQTADLDTLTATWTGPGGRKAISRHHIVGGFYFTLSDLRSLSDMEDTSKYPNSVIREVRRRVEDTFEDATGVAWVPRHSTETIDLSGGVGLLSQVKVRRLRHIEGLTTVQVDAASVTSAGRITGALLSKTALVGFEHGYDALPADLRDAALTFARAQLLGNRTGIPDRATTFTSAEGGTYRLATPGVGGWITGIPEVDEALHRHDHRVPGVA